MSFDISETMRAVRLHPPGGVDALENERLPTPQPGKGEVLVRVCAAALTRNELTWPADRLPAIPSHELSGVVAATGPDTNGFEVGDEVFGMTDFGRDGVASDYTVAPKAELSPKPTSLSHEASAAIPLSGLSAMQGLFDHGRLEKNDRVLIHGGAGGVGGFAVQLARLHGAYVIATASGDRVHRARSLGADQVIDHTSEDFAQAGDVDVVFDTVGGERLLRSVEVLRDGGRLISVAEEPPAARAAEKGIEARWFLVESRSEQLRRLAALAEQGVIQIHVERTYPMSEAADAFRHVMSRGGTGKVVLVSEDSPGRA